MVVHGYTPPHLAELILNSRSALEGERKQVTVLFCDIADSTPLAERLGPERMHGVLNTFFGLAAAEVHRYEGTVNQFLGDGLMALFGAPIAHEDHARRAILAALSIRDTVAKCSAEAALPAGFQLRMGLNTGFVVVGRIGDDLRMDYTAIGDTTNVAARLQGQAEPGMVVISEAVHRHLHGHFEVRLLGERMLKGKTEPVTLLEVRQARKGGPRAQLPVANSELFGRQPELATIQAAVDRLYDGQGGILTITGEAGYGKSRLLDAARTILEARNLRRLEGSCVSFGRTLSYWPFREVLRACFSIAEETPEPDALRRLELGLVPLFGGESDDVLPFVASILALTLSGPRANRLKALDGVAVGHQIFRTTRHLIERLSRTLPLALVLEDWHWADSSSAELLEHLLPLALHSPILFVIAKRPASQGASASLRRALDRDEHLKYVHQALDLSPLGPDACRSLLGSLLDNGLFPVHVRDRLLRQAEGNPFYLGELVRTLIATHAIERDSESGDWEVTEQLDTTQLPDSIEGVILARVDRLEADAKHVLKTAAVVGRTFFYRVLRTVADGTASLDSDIGRLKAAELIESKRESPELELMFKHPLIQRAAYGTLLEDRRRHLHRKVAECTEKIFAERLVEFYPVLAHHYSQAEEWDLAYGYLIKAGDQAERLAADSEALEHYELALTASKSSTTKLSPLQRAELDRRIGEALFRLGRHDAALEHLFFALGCLGVSYPKTRAGVLTAIGRRIAYRAYRQIFLRSAVPKEVLNSDARLKIATEVLVVVTYIDLHRDPLRFVLDILIALQIAESRAPAPELVYMTAALGLVCTTLRLRAMAVSLLSRATRIGENLGVDWALGYCYLTHGMHEYSFGEWPAALKLLASASRCFEAAGHLKYQAFAILATMVVLRSMGDPRWMAEVDKLHRISSESQDEQAIGWTKLWMGGRELHRRNYLFARKYFREACSILEVLLDYRYLVTGLARWGLSEIMLGRIEEGIDLLKRSKTLRLKHRIIGTFATQPIMTTAEAYLAAVERTPDKASRTRLLRVANQACKDAAKHGRGIDDESAAEATRLSGIYAWLIGDKARAIRVWGRGLRLSEKMNANYVLARTHYELGNRTGNASHLAEASSLLAETGASLSDSF